MNKYALVALLGLALHAFPGCGDGPASSGLFVESSNQEGPTAHTAEGGVVHVGKRLPLGDATVSLVSQTNANDQFELRVDSSGIQPGIPKNARLVLVVDGRAWRVEGSRSVPGAGSTLRTFGLLSRTEATTLADALDVTPQERSHPGHALRVTFLPYKELFERDEPVFITFRLESVGERSMCFWHGRMDRPNQEFSFVAHRDGSVISSIVPDINGPYGFNGIRLSQFVAFRLGRRFSQTIDLREWFDLQPGSYSVEGSYRLDFVSGYRKTESIWLDFATGKFEFTVKE